jgi:hypothetical protein
MQQPARDLFGEVPVTQDDIYLWVLAVAPRWLSSERSYSGYCRAWDVPSKIRAAKLAGTFESRIENRAQVWHARLSLNAII